MKNKQNQNLWHDREIPNLFQAWWNSLWRSNILAKKYWKSRIRCMHHLLKETLELIIKFLGKNTWEGQASGRIESLQRLCRYLTPWWFFMCETRIWWSKQSLGKGTWPVHREHGASFNNRIHCRIKRKNLRGQLLKWEGEGEDLKLPLPFFFPCQGTEHSLKWHRAETKCSFTWARKPSQGTLRSKEAVLMGSYWGQMRTWQAQRSQ